MVKTNISSEKTLVDILEQDIISTQKPRIQLLAGHAPLLYCGREDEGGSAELGVHRWGAFSPHTFELGARLARYAIDAGKEANIMLVVDDLIEMPRKQDGTRDERSWVRSAQKRFYRTQDLPEEYVKILEAYGVRDCLAKQQRSFGATEMISERALKIDAIRTGIIGPNECSQAYNALLNNQELFDQTTDYLVGLIPGQCKGNICTGVLSVRDDLDASHVFFPHIETMGGLAGMREGFVKLDETLPLEKIYGSGHVVYVRNEPKDD